jgi:hypothetical protein
VRPVRAPDTAAVCGLVSPWRPAGGRARAGVDRRDLRDAGGVSDPWCAARLGHR